MLTKLTYAFLNKSLISLAQIRAKILQKLIALTFLLHEMPEHTTLLEIFIADFGAMRHDFADPFFVGDEVVAAVLDFFEFAAYVVGIAFCGWWVSF